MKRRNHVRHICLWASTFVLEVKEAKDRPRHHQAIERGHVALRRQETHLVLCLSIQVHTMSYSPQDELVELDTSHSQFLKPPPHPDLPPVSVLLRGVNLSSTSKYPSSRTQRPGADAGSTRTARDDLRRWEAGVETHLSDEDLFWGEAERGGRDGWFVGHPLQEEGMEVCLQGLPYVDAADAEVHLKRLRAWGFTAVRLVVTWEALEHAGP